MYGKVNEMSLFSGLASSFSQYIDLPSLSLDWLVVLNVCYFPILSIGNQNHSQRRRSREAVSGWWVSNWLIEIHTHIYIYAHTHIHPICFLCIHWQPQASAPGSISCTSSVPCASRKAFSWSVRGSRGWWGPGSCFLGGSRGTKNLGWCFCWEETV